MSFTKIISLGVYASKRHYASRLHPPACPQRRAAASLSTVVGRFDHVEHTIIVATAPALIDAVKAVQVLETEDGRLARIGRDCCGRTDRFAAGHGGGLHGR